MTDTVEATQAEVAKNPLEKTLTVTVSGAELKTRTDAELKRTAKKVKMPGFRAGHVPFNMVQAAYGQEAFSRALNDLLIAGYEKAVVEAKLAVAGDPKFAPVENENKESGDMTFNVTVETFPEVTVPDFSAVELKKFTCTVTDEDVAKTVDVMRKQRVTYTEAARAAGADDRVTVNFKGTKDGVAFAGGTADGFQFVIAQGRMLPEFETAVTGMSAGENKTFKLTFPKDYGAKDLAGQEVEFAVECVKVEGPVLPEINDEFAKTLGLEDVAALNKEVRTNLEREVKARVASRTTEQVMKTIDSLATFALPTAIVAREQEALAENAKQDMINRGMDPKSAAKMPVELFLEGAQRRVRIGLMVEKIISDNQINATEEDVRAIVTEMAAAYEKPEEMVEYMMKDKKQLSGLYGVAIERKVVDFVLGKAKTTEEAVAFDQLMVAQPAA